jgi:hypothetical protein
MAVTNSATRSDPAMRSLFLRWPAGGIDPAGTWIDYDPVADELLVYFDRPVPVVSVPINTPDRDYVYLLVDEGTEVVHGIQVDDLRAWVAASHPRWAPLTESGASEEERRAAVAALFADTASLFVIHGTGGE